MKSITIKKEIELINKAINGDREGLVSYIWPYINEVSEVYYNNAIGLGVVCSRDSLEKEGYRYLSEAVSKHMAKVGDVENNELSNIPTFLEYFKWYARQGMLEYINELKEVNSKNIN